MLKTLFSCNKVLLFLKDLYGNRSLAQRAYTYETSYVGCYNRSNWDYAITIWTTLQQDVGSLYCLSLNTNYLVYVKPGYVKKIQNPKYLKKYTCIPFKELSTAFLI
jgi:hypothetical protein